MLNPSTSAPAAGSGRKRPHPIAESGPVPPPDVPVQQVQHPLSEAAASTSAANSSSSFRNVSACNRCRQRKNRCDQRLPRCQACEKAGVHCVGYDPITKREIPRSYVYFLESRVAYLEKVLMDNGIGFNEAVAFDEEEAVKMEAGYEAYAAPPNASAAGEGSGFDGIDKMVRVKKEPLAASDDSKGNPADKEDNWRIQNLVSNIGMVSVQGTSDPRYLGSTSGISFARVVFAAVKSSVPGDLPRGTRPKERLPHSATGTEGSIARDSFFGLQTRPMMECAAFPDRELAERLADLYFEHANPQIPIVHRVDFMELLDRTYSMDEKDRSPRSLYFLNIVFAIGSGIIFEDKPADEQKEGGDHSPLATKRQRLSSHQYQPEEYHASAIVHLESFLSTSSTTDGFGALEELQAVLLLASFALLRPVAPGLWYIVGVAMRLAVDLGLHYEDGAGIDAPDVNNKNSKGKLSERGRREWVRDFRRRLWWCCYSFDRLVSCCVGRPFGISDQAISTEFPSILEDQYITKSGIIKAPEGAPSYKHSAFHYFKLRVLQSEIQDVLQHQQARFARQRGPHGARSFMRLDVVSPFLQGFDSFRSWRRDVDRRLLEWKNSAPMPSENGVRFPLEFLELNYWQAVIMLYQQSLTVPAELADELSPAEDVSSPLPPEEEDEHDIYYKVAEAGQKVIRIYRQMHRVRLVNYTYLATHHIFMAGISFLYAIWHSPYVRSRLTLDEVDFTVLAATSVLGDLMYKCPPAEACRDAFERMSKATVEMSLSTTGFGPQVDLSRINPQRQPSTTHSRSTASRQRQRQSASRRQMQMRQARPVPRFDMNLEDLFGDSRALAERQGGGGGMAYHPIADNSDPNFARPNPQRNPSMEYYGAFDNPVSPQQPQPQPQYYYNNSPQQSGSPGSVVAASGLSTYQATPTEQENPAGMGLDYLDYDPAGVERQMSMGSDENSDYKYQNGAQSLGHGAGHNFGIDLGFGMAVDFQHDWSENANYDLLEGYFFGGGGAPGQGHGHGSGI
ncbi:Zn(II)2Cys6 transcription factor [Aspergillus mulundensis]|uniref:Positive regulator of purine utilization n=1 Tax=Aspergillus mulundensis TaxID=1810919 RepID=A0A3D8SV50_9EURO|nr:Positive regulator of purine utilization [Aspergillus mulundensis]RDW90166.1 Positive regulator of purine utilization [Aspergillus mulundensis]